MPVRWARGQLPSQQLELRPHRLVFPALAGACRLGQGIQICSSWHRNRGLRSVSVTHRMAGVGVDFLECRLCLGCIIMASIINVAIESSTILKEVLLNSRESLLYFDRWPSLQTSSATYPSWCHAGNPGGGLHSSNVRRFHELQDVRLEILRAGNRYSIQIFG